MENKEKIFFAAVGEFGGYILFRNEWEAKKYVSENERSYYKGEIKPAQPGYGEPHGVGEYKGEKFIYLGAEYV